jgi:4-carboxymuconolactone decarboxylase
MPRLPLVDLGNATQAIQDFVKGPGELHIFRHMANAPQCFQPLIDMVVALNREAALPLREREIALLRSVSSCIGEYEWAQHESFGREAGLGDAHLQAIRDADAEADCWEESDRDILRFTNEVIADVKASDATYQRVAKRHSPAEITELLLVIGFYRALATFTENAETPVDPSVGRQALDTMKTS